MKSNRFIFALVITVAFAIVGAGISLFFSKFIDFSDARGIETVPQKSIAAKQAGGAVVFNPPLPQDAPTNIKDAVILGYNILTDTRKYAAGYVGNKLDCDNCHFKGGMTEGGKNGGLSLVGVAATYPEYKKRQNYSVDLVTRTNDCFQRSMNGKPLPADSKEMIAIVTYYQWISKGLPIYADIPWLGVKHFKSAYKPDAAKGKQVFAKKCAMCHGGNGQGTLAAPPLLGKDSFNDGAGMAKLDNFSAFAHFNMPLGNPDLSIEEALDVAVFVTTGPRPHFTEKTRQGS
jgi:thiosulfate dehydrogenase